METVPFIAIAIFAVFFVLVRRAIAAQMKQNKALATIDGFNPAVKYNGSIGGLGLALDPSSNRFAVSAPGSEPTLYDFAQLVAVDVERNGATVTTTKGSNGLAGAAVGVALLGPAGLLLGGGTRSKGTATPTVTKLSLKIYVNDLIKPCHEVVFYSNRQGGNASGIMVSNAARQMDEWYGRFRTILAMQANASGIPAGEAASVSDHSSPRSAAVHPTS